MASALGFAYLNIVIVFLSFSISSAKAETLYVTSVAADYGYNASYEWIAKVPSLGDTDPTTVTTTPGVFWGTISPSSVVVDICQYIWDKEYIKFPIWIIPSNNASQESQRVHNMSVQVKGCIRQAGEVVDAAQTIFIDTQTGENLTTIILCLENSVQTGTCQVYRINLNATTINGMCILKGSAIAAGQAFYPCLLSALKPKNIGGEVEFCKGLPSTLSTFTKTATSKAIEGCAKSLREKLLDMAIDIITNGTAFIRGINTGLVILLMALSLYWLL
eukprot:Gb_29831 [translate_table: standard]